MTSVEARKYFRPATIVPVFLMLILLIVAIYYWAHRQPSSRLVFFSVGQGDATMFENELGQRVVIDAGPDDSLSGRLGQAVPWWDRRIDILILSHEHSDHIGGVLSILKRFTVSRVLAPIEVVDADEMLPIIKELKRRVIPLELVADNYEINFSTTSRLALIPDHGVGANEHSLVAVLINNDAKALLMADAGFSQENKIVKEQIGENVDLLKIGHHGSDTATSEEFLVSTKPSLAVISVGKNNRFNLPSGRVLARLKRLGVPYLRTDEVGDVEFRLADGHWLLQ